MSRSTHQFEIKGVDKSASAFASVKSRAATTGAQIKSMVGGAIGAAGAYLSFSAIKGGVDELGKLSDIAARTSTDVGELTRATAAFSALGVQNMGVDQFAKSMDYLAKNTGRTGMEGFYQTIDELGKIPDLAARSEMAMKVFGKSGMAFMPLINAADGTVDALRTVMDAMPMVPQSAADAGDATSDAMGFVANQVKSIWLQGLGAICGWFDNEFTGGVREAALSAGNHLEYFTKKAVAKCITWFGKLRSALSAYGQAAGALIGGTVEKLFGSGGTWADVWKGTVAAWNQGLDEYEDEAKRLDEQEKARTDRFVRNFEQRQIAIEKFQGAYDKAAVSAEARQRRSITGIDIGKSSTKITNDLIMGSSNAAARLQLLGPSFQSESKKQTSLLEKIATNTEKTAENTEGSYESQDMGVID